MEITGKMHAETNSKQNWGGTFGGQVLLTFDLAILNTRAKAGLHAPFYFISAYQV